MSITALPSARLATLRDGSRILVLALDTDDGDDGAAWVVGIQADGRLDWHRVGGVTFDDRPGPDGKAVR